MTATSISSPRTARVRARPSAPSCRRRTGRRWRRPRGPPASTKGSESRSQEIHHGPAGEADKTEQHHKRISINITRLQPDRETGPPSDERGGAIGRAEEHTSELQSLMRNSYAAFFLKKKK